MPERVITLKHQWVKMSICDIEVLSDNDGNPIVLVDPDKQTQAEEEARYGCFTCNSPLESGFGTPCRGELDNSAAA